MVVTVIAAVAVVDVVLANADVFVMVAIDLEEEATVLLALDFFALRLVVMPGVPVPVTLDVRFVFSATVFFFRGVTRLKFNVARLGGAGWDVTRSGVVLTRTTPVVRVGGSHRPSVQLGVVLTPGVSAAAV